MSDLILFWHRRDLRISDNLGLAAAWQRTSKVIGVFCLDDGILRRNDVASARVAYLIGCLRALQQRYIEAGSQLLIIHADPQVGLPKLADALGALAVYWNRDVEPYSRSRDRAVAAALKEKGIEIRIKTWDQLLHAPGDIQTSSGSPYTVYTPFWRNWSRQTKADPAAQLETLQGLSAPEWEQAENAGVIPLPDAKDLGFTWSNELPLLPGEKAAQAQLSRFCEAFIQAYDIQRNVPSAPGTSLLSPALKFGAIGIRKVWAATVEAMEHTRSDEARVGINTWRQELAWREFYQHVMYFFPDLAEGPYRQPLKAFPWDNDKDRFQAWSQGKTGYPIVDAAMRQLNQTGWMHNRCRMIVASFLTKDLIIDWRWGERYFMQTLVDGDLSANNGGWQWSASSGMDPKPLRIFNPASQAKKFDPDADYIRQWLPEIRSLDTAMLVTGKIPEDECDRCNYPTPIVDHKKQQAIFKERYRLQKAAVTQ
ncbi:MAG: FAD-binding domain-containing protein [Leptolyngbyaceae cyanobacterium MO_188.B28]|nr:FAD-binding domain-containing protein [Leptolyngbyaceae cyanobacterium MO_188.B28]